MIPTRIRQDFSQTIFCFEELRCGTFVFLRNDLATHFGDQSASLKSKNLKDIPKSCNDFGPFSISMFSVERSLMRPVTDVEKLAQALKTASRTGDATIATIYDRGGNEIALVDLT